MTISDIVNRIYFLTGTTGDSSATVKGDYTNADLLIAINATIDRIASLILMADLRWRWDDFNQTDLPIATAALVANQQDYSISSTHLIIERIEIKDSSGNWHLLKPIDQSLLKRDRKSAMTEYQETAGRPNEYDLIGDSILLYPKPNYSQAASLKIHFARGPAVYTSAQIWTNYVLDGTKVPGFNSLFHDLVPLNVSLEYAELYLPEKVKALFAKVQKMEKALQNFYAKRQNDGGSRLTTSTDSNK